MKTFSSIAIIGTGKIAHSFVYALVKAGAAVESVIGDDKLSASKFAKKFNIPRSGCTIAEVPKKTTAVFLAVPDGIIEKMACELSSLQMNWKRISVIHFSGSKTIEALKCLDEKGARTASLHIMQTFPSLKPVNIVHSFAGIETRSGYLKKELFRLTRTLLLQPFEIKTEQKALYHLSGVFVSNFMTANIHLAEAIFNRSEITGVSFTEMMRPIILTTQNNILKYGTGNSLSGPIERGDLETVNLHISTLKRDGTKTELAAFVSLSLSLLSLIKHTKGRLTPEQKRIDSVLKKLLAIK